MKKLELIKQIDFAILNQEPIALIFNTGEIIINPVKNLKDKRTYYFNAYDEDCRLINKNDIIIVDIVKSYLDILKLLKEKIG